MRAANDNGLFYTYVWRDNSGTPFYVGKGRNRRAWDVYDRSPEFKAIHSNGGCTVGVVDWFIHESQALAHEVELIAAYRQSPDCMLVNKTDGGEGASGHIKSPESIALWRKRNLGRKRDATARANISAGKTGSRHSEETKRLLSDISKRRFEEDPSLREGRRIAMLSITSETRARMSEAQKARFIDPAERLKASIAASRPMPEDVRLKISHTTTGRRKDAAAIESMRRAQRMKPPRGRFKGVHVAGSRYRAVITIDGCRRDLGLHDTEEAAAMSYDKAAIAAWGSDGCYLNFSTTEAMSA